MTEWTLICKLEDIPVLGSRRVERASGLDVAVFRNSQDEVFALLDRCPHKGGPLSQGIVFGTSVACPLHNWGQVPPQLALSRVRRIDGINVLGAKFLEELATYYYPVRLNQTAGQFAEPDTIQKVIALEIKLFIFIEIAKRFII